MEYMCFYCGKWIDGLVSIYYKHGGDYVCCDCEEKYHKHADSKISRLKYEAEKWERIAMLAEEEKHKAIEEVGRLRDALVNIYDYGIDRDGEKTVKRLGELVDELVSVAKKALDTSE